MERKQITFLVLFDFEKAFDSIPHDKILEKLRSLNCSDLVINWFAEYLSNRSQSVQDDEGVESDWSSTFTGVPQGSVLGPILFLIFINDIHKAISFCKHVLFADDLQIFYSCDPRDVKYGLDRVKHDVEAISRWASENGVRLNLAKTKIMVLGSPAFVRKVNQSTLPKLIVNNTAIPFVDEALNLGVIFQQTLSWEKHTSKVVQKVHQVLYTLKHIKKALSFSLKKYLVETLIFPHFHYACAALSDIDETQNLRLQRAQNACVRFVFSNTKEREHITPYRLALEWLSIKGLRECSILNQAYSILAHGSNKYLMSKFAFFPNDGTIRRTERLPKESLVIPFASNEHFRKSFSVSASRLLNALNISLFQPDYIQGVKSRVFYVQLENEKSEWENRVVRERIAQEIHLPIHSNAPVTFN